MADLATQMDTLARQLSETAEGLRSGSVSAGANSQRWGALRKASKAVMVAVQKPGDEFADLVVDFGRLVAIRLFIQWKAFEKIPAEGDISYDDLAARLGGEKALITRFAWMLVSVGILKQNGVDRVAHTPNSLIYASLNPVSAMLQMAFDENLPCLIGMPAYFARFGLKEPTDRHNTIRAFSAGQSGKTVWEIQNAHPERMVNMMLAMAALESIYPLRSPYDYSWVAAQGAKQTDRALVVDVGGGKGHVLKAIVEATPGLDASRCVLQDLEPVVAKARETDDEVLTKVRMESVDFHAEQPVKGAFVYHMRRCMHDYGDAECVEILQHVSDAMSSDSKLLIVEQVMSNPPAPSAAATDVFIAAIGGKERTVEGFRDIAGKAGLGVLKVWRMDGMDFAVVECAKV